MTPRDTLAVIAGSGAGELLGSCARNAERLGPVPTPFGLSAPLYRLRIGEAHFVFLPRHGEPGREVSAPWINYRANIYALKENGITHILAWSGPAAVDNSLNIADHVLPDDLIDETRGRESSFYKGTALGLLRQRQRP